jgi:hypothetical protein
MSNEIETEYRKRINSLSGSEKVLRAVDLYEDFKRMLFCQMQKEYPSASERELEILCAKRRYQNDLQVQDLIIELENELRQRFINNA